MYNYFQKMTNPDSANSNLPFISQLSQTCLKKQNGQLNSDLRVQDPYWSIYQYFKRSQMKEEWIWVKTSNLAFEQWANSAFYRLLLLPANSRSVFQEMFHNSSYIKWQIILTLFKYIFLSLESNALFYNSLNVLK